MKTDKSLRKKSKEELKALLEYLEKAKENLSETAENIKTMYNRLLEKHDTVKKEVKKRGE